MRLGLGAVLALSVLITAAGCGGGAADPGASPPAPGPPAPSPSSSSSTAPDAPSATTTAGNQSQLTVVVDDGTGATTTWTLTCEPAGGTHPEAEQACAAVDQHRTALSPVPTGRMCAQVYGGPERATVTGTWRGEQVSAALSRTDACETARWDALVPLVPSGGR